MANRPQATPIAPATPISASDVLQSRGWPRRGPFERGESALAPIAAANAIGSGHRPSQSSRSAAATPASAPIAMRRGAGGESSSAKPDASIMNASAG